MILELLVFIFATATDAPELAQYDDLSTPINETHMRRDGYYPWSGDHGAGGYSLSELWMLDVSVISATQATVTEATFTTVQLGANTAIFDDGLFTVDTTRNALYEADQYFYWDSDSNESAMVLDADTGNLTIEGNFAGSNFNGANWDTAYADRMKWDGGSTGLVAATGRTSLELGSAATRDAEDALTNGSNLPDGAAITSFVGGQGFWDSVSDVPTATPSNGDTTHLSTADQIYDYVVGRGYLTNPLSVDLNLNSYSINNINNLDIIGDVDLISGNINNRLYWLDVLGDHYLDLKINNDSDPADYGALEIIDRAGGVNFTVFRTSRDWGTLIRFEDSAFVIEAGTEGGSGVDIMSATNGGIKFATNTVIDKYLEVGYPSGSTSEGDINISGSYLTNGSDFGEWFRTSRAGAVPLARFVTIDNHLDRGVRLATPDDDYIIGVSTDGSSGFYGDNESRESENPVAVGIIGKVDIAVDNNSTEIIRRGDGVIVGANGTARRCARGIRPVGRAIENQRQGVVKIFIK